MVRTRGGTSLSGSNPGLIYHRNHLAQLNDRFSRKFTIACNHICYSAISGNYSRSIDRVMRILRSLAVNFSLLFLIHLSILLSCSNYSLLLGLCESFQRTHNLLVIIMEIEWSCFHCSNGSRTKRFA